MKLLSHWFRRAPSKPSWIEPVALAAQIEGDAALLVLDVRGPDEFTGPLGHIREARNLPQQLQQAGKADVSVLRGGMERWQALGLPAS